MNIFQNVSTTDANQARALVTAILADGGNTISINDGECWVVKRSRNPVEIMEAMGSTCEDIVKVHNVSGEPLGNFYLVYGNGDDELIADHSDNDYCGNVWKSVTSV